MWKAHQVHFLFKWFVKIVYSFHYVQNGVTSKLSVYKQMSFPMCVDEHWFVRAVCLKSKYFAFLDSLYDSKSQFHQDIDPVIVSAFIIFYLIFYNNQYGIVTLTVYCNLISIFFFCLIFLYRCKTSCICGISSWLHWCQSQLNSTNSRPSTLLYQDKTIRNYFSIQHFIVCSVS